MRKTTAVKRFVASLIGSVVFAFLLQWTFGMPPWNLTVLVIMLLVMYEEARGWLAPSFVAIGNLLNFLQRMAVTLGAFYLLRFMIWEVTGFGFLDSLNSWKGVGTKGLFDNGLAENTRERILVEIAAFIVVFAFSYMFAKEVVPPPAPRKVETNEQHA